MKILLVESDVAFRDLICMRIESQYDVDLYELSSGNEALTILEMDKEFDIIFTEALEGKTTGSGDVILKYLKDHHLDIPMIVFAPIEDKNKPLVQELLNHRQGNRFFPKTFKEDDYLNLTDNICEIAKKKGLEGDWVVVKGPKQEQEENVLSYKNEKKEAVEADWEVTKEGPKEREDSFNANSNYMKIKINRFLNFNSVCADIYVKINEQKYIKVIKAHDLYDEEKIMSYKSKGAKYLYIPSVCYPEFQDSFSNLVMNRLKSTNLKDSERSLVELASYEDIHERARAYGISQAAIRQAEATTESSINLIKKDPDLLDLFQNIMRGKNYISEHSLMLTYVLTNMALKTNWGSASTIEKLSMASILHDSFLDEQHDELARDHDEKRDIDEVEEEFKTVVLEHPTKAAALIRNGKTSVPDVDNIILQHHEEPDGSGYPSGRTANTIAPLSCLFIIGEKIVNKIFTTESTELDHAAYYEELKLRYNKGNFKKALDSYKKAFIS